MTDEMTTKLVHTTHATEGQVRDLIIQMWDWQRSTDWQMGTMRCLASGYQPQPIMGKNTVGVATASQIARLSDVGLNSHLLKLEPCTGYIIRKGTPHSFWTLSTFAWSLAWEEVFSQVPSTLSRLLRPISLDWSRKEFPNMYHIP